MSLRVDAHQHLWTEPLIEALARRNQPPLIRSDPQGWVVRVSGEPESLLAREACSVEARVEQLEKEDLDLALVSLSSALGIEALPSDEAQSLIAAYRDGISALPSVFRAWGAVGLRSIEVEAVDALLAEGFVGLSLPAGALATPSALERCGPLLERLEQLNAPLFIHPGPSPWEPSRKAAASLPIWWPALTDYVAGMNAAWHAFTVIGRDNHPNLRVLFAMLAGAATVQLERLASRGIESLVGDPNTFYDSSSYGPEAVTAVAGRVGIDQIVYGSDRPVVTATTFLYGNGVNKNRLARNGARLLKPSVATP